MEVNPFAESIAYAMLIAVSGRHAAREGMVFRDERITFADFRARVDAFAGGLAALGLARGDAVAIWLPNRPLWFIAQYAFCRGKIASYKIPRAVRFVSDVPRTPGAHGDKVQRVRLREQAIQEMGR